MDKKQIDDMLDRLSQEVRPDKMEFCSEEDFKKKFLERIRVEEEGAFVPKKIKWGKVTAYAASFVVISAVAVAAFGNYVSSMFDSLAYSVSGVASSASYSLQSTRSAETADFSTANAVAHQSGSGIHESSMHSAEHNGYATESRVSPIRWNSPRPAPPRSVRQNEESPAPAKIDWNTEEYKSYEENPFLNVFGNPLSTFGADVDTASYTNVRRYLNRHRMPPRDAVRIEEFVNSFKYNYAAPKNGEKFSVTYESAPAPWNKKHQLLLIGIQGKDIPVSELPPANYVFLVDNSGSMRDEMELVIESLTTLINQMREQDKISLVTYGGGVRTLLNGISGKEKGKAISLIKQLRSGGYTPGSKAIQTAYELAHKHFIQKGNNRIILITDGDFNVGVSSESELVAMVEKERSSLIYLSTFGVGSGNYQENKLKMLANKGYGNYFYIDNLKEARVAMKACFAGRMFALARDVKFQVEFNPAKVSSYRLLGYEMRKLADRDFNDDTKDSGEIGVGHQVTVLYELIPAGVESPASGSVDPLKYQRHSRASSDEILTCKLRYQDPAKMGASELRVFPMKTFPKAGENLSWASCVAEFAMILRNSPHKGSASLDSVLSRAKKYLGEDPDGKRAEFLTLVHTAKTIK